jgi:clan AA aspartic protease
MTAQPTQQTGGRIRQVGKVLTTLTVTNRVDEALSERGSLSADKVRSVTITDVMVDTGATTLCLPIGIIRQLGLPLLRTMAVTTATGDQELELYEDAKIELEGRSGTFECIALPDGRTPLLGVVPLEMLGLEPDLQNQRLRVLPEAGRDNYMFALSPTIF